MPHATNDKTDLKAGHAPAVKVGGMRVVQHPHPHPAPTQAKDEKEKEEALYATDKPGAVVATNSGMKAKGDFSSTDVDAKVAHEKPHHATKEKPPHKGPAGQPTMHLKQPSKQ